MIDNILIHTCCAECLLNSLEYFEKEELIKKRGRIVCLFFNPNIHPRSEYVERLNAVKKVLDTQKSRDIKLVIPDYRPKEYFKSIEGRERRCLGCWEMRLSNLYEYAKENGFENITSTLLVSHYQDREEILNISKEINRDYNLNFIDIDSRHNCKSVGFYKQNYCGCCFSLVERMTNTA